MEDKDKIIAELKAYKDVNEDFKTAWEELKAENARLTSLLGEYSLKADAYRNAEDITQQSNYDLSMENFKQKQTLQKIKAIAKDTIDCKQYEINHDCFNDTRCKALREFIETLQEIIDLITKAEEE